MSEIASCKSEYYVKHNERHAMLHPFAETAVVIVAGRAKIATAHNKLCDLSLPQGDLSLFAQRQVAILDVKARTRECQ